MAEWLVTGAGGALGSVLMRVLAEDRHEHVGLVSPTGPRPQLGKVVPIDLCELPALQERVFSIAPKVIVHLGAVAQLAKCLEDPELAHRVNVEATAKLVEVASALGARLLFASTDLVFDGEAAPYDEDAAPEPCSVYGLTKLEAESHVLTYKRGLVARFPLLYGVPEVSRAPSFFESLVTSLRTGQSVSLFHDEVRTPLWLDDAAHACVALAVSALTGTVHVGGPDRLSRLQMGELVAAQLDASRTLLRPASRDEVSFPEPRPRDVSLNSNRYLTRMGHAPGRSMRDALPLIFQRKASGRLS
jgi:dTDP-4-dehydrorhamnose reductase